MGTKTLELNAVCVSDWEADHLREVNPVNPTEGFIGGISELIRGAGGTTVSDGVVFAFDDVYDDDDGFWASLREEYQKASGLEVPPVMRVKVTVEVGVLNPEDSKTLWEAHKEGLRLHQRAGEYADAVREAESLYETLRARLGAGHLPSAEELTKLDELRAHAAKLQPTTLKWLITTREGATIQVDTRDMTTEVGAIAEIPPRDPASGTAKVRERSYLNDGIVHPDRESDHRMAVEILGANNDWWVTSITRNGETWDS